MPARFVLAVASAALLAGGACSPSQPKPASPGGANAPAPSADAAFTITATDGLPAELAAERPMWESASRPATGTRLYRDGRLYSYSDRRRTVVDGQTTFVAAPPAWRLADKLSATALRNVDRVIRQRIAQGHLVARAAAPTVPLVPDQYSITYRAWVDDVEHVRVVSFGTSRAVPDLPTPMTAIEGAIQRGIVAGAVPTEQP
jgi:hypothetical protein